MVQYARTPKLRNRLCPKQKSMAIEQPNCRKENTNKLGHETEQKSNGQVHNRYKKTSHSECIELITKSERDTGSLNQYRNENYTDLWKNFKEPICPGDEIQCGRRGTDEKQQNRIFLNVIVEK